ncbi:hypothetical protein [Haladaptatus sp. DYSN1]|uniref:hypothetical protein n=1 Tax=unclassified Haladaptatus TaxID=2622732 RepID=UPI00240695EA|nr:hypothetical protein [Haladaptatus sp. DYSN1]
MNWRPLVRIYTMVGVVSTISLFVFSAQFTGTGLSIAIVAVGTVALISVILGGLLAIESYVKESDAEAGIPSRP